MSSLLHRKRGGTGGVSGQLYETKLLSLILFTMLHDDDITEFYMGTNVDGIGDLDDVCLRFYMKGLAKSVAVFIQAKHRDNTDRRLTANTLDLPKYFDSYLKIRNKFDEINNDDDPFFKGPYSDVECLFIYYTTSKDDLDKHYDQKDHISKTNDIICTGEPAFQHLYTDKDMELLHEMVVIEKIKKLGVIVAKIVKTKGNSYVNMMNEELLYNYHVILGQKVFNVSEELYENSENGEKYRNGSFKFEFFDTFDEHLLHLKDSLFSEMLKDNKPAETAIVNDLLNQLFDDPSEDTISKLIGGVIRFENNKLGFVDKEMNRDVNLKEKLHRVNVSQSAVARAVDIAGKNAMKQAEFKLHRSFGNSDLTVRKERRINHLATRMIEIMGKAKPCDVDPKILRVTIDECFIETTFLDINGGIASAVGNLLVYDEETKLLKFATGTLSGHAKTLFQKIDLLELDRYRFIMNVKAFPKLVFDYNEYDQRFAEDFKRKLLFCTSQASQFDVEVILKDKIRVRENTCNFQIKSDAIYLKYHDEVQKWWLKQTEAEYQTKETLFYLNAKEGAIGKPLLSITNVLNKNRIASNGFKFTANAVGSLNYTESDLTITVIVTEVIDMSVAKLSQRYIDTDLILIDLNYVLSLPDDDRLQLNAEMLSMEGKTFILTFNSFIHVTKIYDEIKDILLKLDGNKRIVVTSAKSGKSLKSNLYGDFRMETLHDESSLLDLTQESHENIFENTYVTFQGEEVRMKVLFDEESKACIKGEHINKIANGESLQIGKPLTDSKYEDIKQLYISRNVTKNGGPSINLETFYDIDEHTVLITAMPGMGKSCLLTHLSLMTKARYPESWIVRINLVDFSQFFGMWQKTKAALNKLEALRFICIALITKTSDDKDSKAVWSEIIRLTEDERGIKLDMSRLLLKNQNTELKREIIFKINMFLHFCNKRKVIFLFDGFDEICPYYQKTVLTFLSILKDYRPNDHRIWITSRTYNEILDILEVTFGASHQLQPLTYREQEIYIERFLHTKINLIELREKINEFIIFMAQSYNWRGSKCLRIPMHTVYFIAAQYFRNELKRYIKAWVHKSFNVPSSNVYEEYKGYWNYLNAIDVMSNPLHINIVADYFQSEINDDAYIAKWDQHANTFAMYERFMNTKFEKICFVEKCNIDLYIPNIQNIIERERETFIDKHKKLAAYGIFIKHADRIFSESDLEGIRNILKSIKSGKEKTGVVHSVIDDVPRFVHLTFAEYFAVDYICDLLKSETTDRRVASLWDFILNIMLFKNNVGVLNIFDDKLGADEELKRVVSEDRHRRIIFDLLMKQSAGVLFQELEHETQSRNMIHSSLHKSLLDDLRNLTTLLLSTLKFLNWHSLPKFIEIVVNTETLKDAIDISNEEFVHAVVDTVREIDVSQLEALFKNIPFDVPTTGSNEEIITSLRSGMPRIGRSPTDVQKRYYNSFMQNCYGAPAQCPTGEPSRGLDPEVTAQVPTRPVQDNILRKGVYGSLIDAMKNTAEGVCQLQ